jgi:Fe-Mn family superoxide dismutase
MKENQHALPYHFNRRRMLGLLAATSVAAVTGLARIGETAMTETSASTPKSPKPLPFDPSKLEGFSERLVVSHHQNNYAGAVKRLNLIEQKIAGLPPDAAPFQMGALQREKLVARNSMVLHELYFANLGGSAARPKSVTDRLARAFGSAENWEREFRATAMSLAGGSGWVLLCADSETGALFNSWSWDHTNVPAGAKPLLVMDMYEHSYHIDYGADAKSYIDAFFRNIDWSRVEQRIG